MTTIIAERLHGIPALSKGRHYSISQGACLLEAVSWVAGEQWSARPDCASPVIGAYGRTLNDILSDDKRQRLIPLVPRIIGTGGDGHDQERGFMVADWLIRVYTATWLRAAGLEEAAAKLESLPRQATRDDMNAAFTVVREVRDEADAAEATLRDPEWDADRVVARIAVEASVWDALQDAGWTVTGTALRVATQHMPPRAATELITVDAARTAARAAAVVAAIATARDTTGIAARDALRPTVYLLQDSAIDLFTRLVVVEHLPE